jgi:hypothetical protein
MHIRRLSVVWAVRSWSSPTKAQPPRRFLAGADAIGLAEQKIAKLREEIESHRDLSTSLGITADDNGVPVRVG